MNLLRIHVSLFSPTLRGEWVLISEGHENLVGEGLLSELPQHADRIQLILPASQVLITRTRVPLAARRSNGSTLAYAIEDETLSEPDANQVSWLGKTENHNEADDLLAVIDKSALTRWQNALEVAGIRNYEIHCETLMLPYTENEWSLLWKGMEGYIRTGEFEGAATDCSDRYSAPLTLNLLLEEANIAPTALVVYTSGSVDKPDIKKWSQDLGLTVRYAGPWDWRSAPADSGVNLLQKSKKWRVFTGALRRLHAAAWILGAALLIHAVALAFDQFSLAREQYALREKMEHRFREVFPDAVSIADPALQMRRKLSDARNATGHTDNSDFLVMIEPMAIAMQKLPAGSVHIISYDKGRVNAELSTTDKILVENIMATLRQSGMTVELISPSVISVSAS